MFINDKLIYIELHKTGGTHTEKILYELSSKNNNNKIIRKHNTYDTIASEILGDFKNKIKIGNIRNPWDWYVSLWAFGCMKKGNIYRIVSLNPNLFSLSWLKSIIINKSLRSHKNRWDKVYSDHKNTGNFKTWLKMILSEKNISIGEGYKESYISSEVGLLTYRYLKLYTYNGRKSVSKIKDFNSVLNYDKENNFMDVIIKAETLHDDLFANIKLLGYDKFALKNILNNFQSKTNKSNRTNYRDYYDKETIDLVKEKEKLIIDKYGYSF